MINNLRSKFLHFYYRKRPVRFIAPLSIDECAKRLQESIGKPLGCSFDRIQGKIEKVDERTYKFLLYQVSKGQRYSVEGYLYVETESSTLVDSYHVTEKIVLISLFIPMSVLIVLIFNDQLQKQGLLNALLAAGVIIIILVGLIAFNNWIESLSQLVWYIERTLKN